MIAKQFWPIIGVSLAVLIYAAGLANAEPSPDEALREAREFRLKAMRGHCTKVGLKTAAVFGGRLDLKDDLQNSIAWFTDEYGKTPEEACQAEDPLGFGAAQE